MGVTIMLACAGGMSSSMLAVRMQKAAAARHLDATVFARGFGAIPQAYRKSHPDVILLGPQVRYVLRSVQKEVPVPVAVINMTDYGMMDGEKVLTQALDLLSQK